MQRAFLCCRKTRLHTCISLIYHGCARDKSAVLVAQEDADVAAERTRVISTDDTDDVIRLCNLRKQYGGSITPVRLKKTLAKGSFQGQHETPVSTVMLPLWRMQEQLMQFYLMRNRKI